MVQWILQTKSFQQTSHEPFQTKNLKIVIKIMLLEYTFSNE